ncbi:PilZ domain-containing protein [Paucidesulfovibrio longus]|uniref:PilZ domain-containing protein n=1 Tax=Paucidesulfovibrio longus TaxID=889 RepID=UPI0009DB8CF8|nr:PilZ domain-containing protein [Paucidesulfovibrio longus]
MRITTSPYARTIPTLPALLKKGAWILLAVVLLSGAPAQALAQGKSFDPAELQQLEQMEQQNPVSSVSGGDYALTPHILSTLFQIAFFLLPPFVLGYAAARRRSIVETVSRIAAQVWRPDGRRFARITTAPDTAKVSLLGADNQVVCEGCLVDISKGGIGIKLAKGQAPPPEVTRLSLEIEVNGKKKMQLSEIPAALSWMVGDKIGLQFERALSFSQETLAELFSPRELAMATVRSR